MSYLTPNLLYRESRGSLTPKNSVSYFTSEDFIKRQKKKSISLYKYKGVGNYTKQDNTKKKTRPLILFVNLLMKDGKKNHALRILSMTLSLFKTRILKKKFETNFDSLKRSKSFYHCFLKTFGIALDVLEKNHDFAKSKHLSTTAFAKSKHLSAKQKHGTCSTSLYPIDNFITNYSIKERNFYVALSRESYLDNNIQYSNPSNVLPWFLRHKKAMLLQNPSTMLPLGEHPKHPFSFNFFFLLNSFYAKKRFFCGKFINLKHFNVIENKDQKLFVLLDEKNKKKKKEIYREYKEGDKISRKKVSLKKCLWYKTLAKKPSWEYLTTPQKNTFLYCLYTAISNVKPPLECRTKRIGGSNKQVPSHVSEHRQWGIALRWIIEAAEFEFSKKKNRTVAGFYKDFFRANLNRILDTSGNTPEKPKIPRGVSNLSSSHSFLASKAKGLKAFYEEKVISSLLEKKSKADSLKLHCPKTKFHYFCFFLAESLENAYYKRGLAMEKRNLWVDTALANRAFLRYRWW